MKFTLSLICLAATLANTLPLISKMHNDILGPRSLLDAVVAEDVVARQVVPTGTVASASDGVSTGVGASSTADASTDSGAVVGTGTGVDAGSDMGSDGGSGNLGVDVEGLDVGLDRLGVDLGSVGDDTGMGGLGGVL